MRGQWFRFLLATLLFNSVASIGLGDLSFQFLTTHPDAVMQPTVRGKTLLSMSWFNNQLYFGYGDWAADTGPMRLRGYNTSTGQWSGPLLTFGSEAISHYREIGNSLYAVNLDPLGLPQVNPGGFARGEVVSPGVTSWAQFDNVPATHDFDIVASNGNNLWVVGSQNTLASIWRSTDGGQSFSLARQDGPAPGSPSFVFSRYTGVAYYNNMLYVQRTDVNGADVTNSLTFDGTNWNAGPDLLSVTNGFLVRPTEFNGMLVYLDDDLGLGNLYRFDGSQSSLAYANGVRDYFIYDGKIFALTANGEVISSSNLSQWDVLGLAPSDARSIGVVDHSIYVGTSNATIFWSPNSIISAVPEPSAVSLIVFGTVVAYWTRRRVCR
jgi:hypothetical protein